MDELPQMLIKEGDINVSHLFNGCYVGKYLIKSNCALQVYHIFINMIGISLHLLLYLPNHLLLLQETQINHHHPFYQPAQPNINMLAFAAHLNLLEWFAGSICFGGQAQQGGKDMFFLGLIPITTKLAFVFFVVCTQRHHFVQPAHYHKIRFTLLKGLLEKQWRRLKIRSTELVGKLFDEFGLDVCWAKYLFLLSFPQAVFFEDALVLRVEVIEIVSVKLLKQSLRPFVLQV